MPRLEKFLVFNCLHDKYGFSQAVVTPSEVLFAKSKVESTLGRQLWSLWMWQVPQESQNAAAPVSLLLATGGQGHVQATLHLRPRQQYIYIHTYMTVYTIYVQIQRYTCTSIR